MWFRCGINEIQVAVRSHGDRSRPRLPIRHIRARLPVAQQPKTGRVGEHVACIRIEHVYQAIVAHRDTQNIFVARTAFQMHFVILVAVGKENESAASPDIRQVDRAAAIHGDRLRIFQPRLPERKQRPAFPSELVNEAASGIGEVNVPKRIGRDIGRLIQLAGVSALHAPRRDIRNREWRRRLRLHGYIGLRAASQRATQSPALSSSRAAKLRRACEPRKAPSSIFPAACLHMLILPFDRRYIARFPNPPHAGLAHLVETLLRTPAAPILKRKRRIAARRPRQFQRQFSA